MFALHAWTCMSAGSTATSRSSCRSFVARQLRVRLCAGAAVRRAVLDHRASATRRACCRARRLEAPDERRARSPSISWPSCRRSATGNSVRWCSSIQVHPGQLYEADFFAHNLTGHDTTAQAVPDIAPSKAAACFTRPNASVSRRSSSRRRAARHAGALLRRSGAAEVCRPHRPCLHVLRCSREPAQRIEHMMSQTQTHDASKYYVPHDSHWPIIGSVALFCLMAGAVSLSERLGGRLCASCPARILLARCSSAGSAPSSTRTSTASTTWTSTARSAWE